MTKAALRRRARQYDRVTRTTSTVQPLVSGPIDTTNGQLPSALHEPTTTVSKSLQAVLASVEDDTENAEGTAVEATTTACDLLAPVSARVVDNVEHTETCSVIATTNVTRPLRPNSAGKENPSASPSLIPSVNTQFERGSSTCSPLQATPQSQRTDSLSPSLSSFDKESKAAELAVVRNTTEADTSSSTPVSLAESESTSGEIVFDDSETADSATVWDEACVRTSSPAPASPIDRHSTSKNAAVNAFRAAIHATVTYGTFVDTSTVVTASPQFNESTPEDTFVEDSKHDGDATISVEACVESSPAMPATLPVSGSASENLGTHESKVDGSATNSDTACRSTPAPAPLPPSEDPPKITTPAPCAPPHSRSSLEATMDRLPTLKACVASGYLKVVAGSTDGTIRKSYQKAEKKEVQEPPREEPLTFDDRPHYLWADIAYYDKRHQVSGKLLPEAPAEGAVRRGVCDEARLETPACGYSGCVGWI
ncbi:hypothetical protein LTR95_002912 [Oleoguttula sp. CCFEE 5521]